MTVNAPRMRFTVPRASIQMPGSRRRISRARLQRPGGRFAATAACGVALGAVLEYFFDPGAGRRRRHTTRDRAMSRLRRAERRATRRARRAESHAVGIVRRTLNGRRNAAGPVDDVTLSHKVQSELFRRAHVPKGPIDVNAEDGVVFLRGIAEREEDIARLEDIARRIHGVRAVENLVHMPGTPAPASRPRRMRNHNGA